MIHCSFDGCDNRPTKNGNGRCRAHGGRTKCNHLGCDSFAQKGGKCGCHRADKIFCSATGCTNLPQKNGVCKIHGGTRICKIHGCTGHLFQSRMCKHHFKNSNVCTAINEPAMVGEDDFSNWNEDLNNLVVATTSDISVIEPSHNLTIMDINDLPFGIIQEYVGMNNWENAITFAGVCKSWRIAAEPHLAMIGIAPMEGGCQRKLNVTGFLRYLEQQVKFRFADRIYVPCGLKTEKLFYSEVRLRCEQMTELIHDKWIKTTGNMEYVLEGQSRHACYRMYKHDTPNIPGVNAYIKYEWDKTMKVQLVSEGQFVQLFTNRRRSRIQTSFLRY
jgi:hypothetical protein